MILLIDNYDSFTYNLAQYLGELGAEVAVHRNDKITLEEIAALNPSHIIISPGPGDPDSAGISLAVIERFHATIPILGVCLGHQAIGQAFGGKIIRAYNLMHGKTSRIEHTGQSIFAGLPSPFTATRYHSLVVDEALPDCLEVIAHTATGEMMGLRHKTFPTVGVQFHPEAILTEHGHDLLRNFLGEGSRFPVQSSKVQSSKLDDQKEKSSMSAASTTLNIKPETSNDAIKEAIAKVIERKHLTETEAEAVMTQIMAGQATDAQIGAYLTALRMKGETVAEIVGSARAMRAAAVKVQPATTDLLDTCGTGGDGSGTFNISTTAAFVVAGAGQPVAKHGNRAMSSQSGSADVLEALGVNINLTPDQVAAAIDEIGLGFMFAAKLHPAMKYAIGPRKQIGTRTIFNLLGPLTNPAGASAQIMGVYDKDLPPVIAEVLGGLGNKAAFVVHGYGGLDELTTSGPNRVSFLQNGKVSTTMLNPQALGFAPARAEDLKGGDAGQNALITRAILTGQDTSARRDVVLLNAGAALVAGGKADSIERGISLAEESIKSGAALNVLNRLVAFSNQAA